MGAYRVTATGDPAAFAERAAALLAADPVRTSLLASVTRRWTAELAHGGRRPDHPLWWATVDDGDGSVVGAAMRTAPYEPYPLWVGPMPDAAAAALADAVRTAGETVTEVGGALEPARAVATALAAPGAVVALLRTEVLWEVTDVVPPATPAGRARPAGDDDTDLVTAWIGEFRRDAATQAGHAPAGPGAAGVRREQARRRIRAGEVWLWESAHGPVHLTCVSTPSYGVVRIGPVYTPEAHRGHGYAQTLVARLSAQVLADGHRACLYTDGDNPVANHTYARIGYHRIDEQATFAIRPAAPGAGGGAA